MKAKVKPSLALKLEKIHRDLKELTIMQLVLGGGLLAWACLQAWLGSDVKAFVPLKIGLSVVGATAVTQGYCLVRIAQLQRQLYKE